MLTLLVTEEFRATSYRFAALFFWAVIVIIVALIPFALGIPLLGTIGMFMAFVVIAGTPLTTFVILMVRYWQTMHGRQAAFTHSIPTQPRLLLIAKFLHATVVMVVSTVVMFLLALLYFIANAIATSTPIGESLSTLWGVFTDRVSQLPTSVTVVMLIGTTVGFVSTIIIFQATMSIGAQGRFSHMGFGAPVVGFILVYFILEIVGNLASFIVPFSLKLDGSSRMPVGIVMQPMLPNFIDSVNSGAPPTVIGIASMFVTPIFAIVLAIWAINALKRHLAVK
ncbi:MAG: hypothetical protein CSA82_00620 [Actinobacteria bacterium]|nr:MAG: hypothetical protein CSA82_00620 [Actinomycetota bacterium]